MSDALYNLKNNQQQLDMDGIMVGVSRQALEEVFDEIEALKAEHEAELQEKLRQQREAIKKEVIASVSLPFKIHMEGVFAVIESRINAQIDNNGEAG